MTIWNRTSWQNHWYKFSIFDMVFFESLLSNFFNKDILTVKKFLTACKRTSRKLRNSWPFETGHLDKTIDINSQFLTWSSSRVSISAYSTRTSWKLINSWQLKKGHLNCWETLDSLKKDISTVEKSSTVWHRTSRQNHWYKFSIFDMVFFKSLDTNFFNKDILTVEKLLTA